MSGPQNVTLRLPAARDASRGMALLMVMSCLVLFVSLLAFSVASTVYLQRISNFFAAGSRMSAESGLEYAAARLSREGVPLHPGSPARRGDAWLSPGIPAFCHGEPWHDAAPEDGLFQAGEPWLDRDADGLRADWSGRVRGGLPPLGHRFTLWIEAVEGRIPLATGGDPVSLRGLAHLLNNLGALLLPDGHPRRARLPSGAFAAGSPAVLYEVSWLGEDLDRLRPAGGYASSGKVRTALLAAGYGETDADRILPFLWTGPFERPAEWVRSPLAGSPSPAIGLWTARREVLHALWRHLGAPTTPAARQGNGWSAILSGRSGDPIRQLRYTEVAYQIDPQEADALADLVMELRARGDLTWRLLRTELLSRSASLFAGEAADLAEEDRRMIWCQGKADLAYQAVTPDPFPLAPGFSPVPAWEGGGIDRDRSAPGLQQRIEVAFDDLRGLRLPASPGDGWGPDPFLPLRPDGADPIVPVRTTLAQPVLFEVRSRAVRSVHPAEARGILRTAERLELGSQEDFEILSGGAGFARRGIAVAADLAPALRRDWRTSDPLPDGAVRSHPHVASLPERNLRSFVPGAEGSGSFPRAWGALSLASLEAGRAYAASLYWPLTEDFDYDASTDGLSEGDPPYGPYPLPVRNAFEGGGTLRMLQIPGLTGPAGSLIQRASFDLWMRPNAKISVNRDGFLMDYFVKVFALPDEATDGTRFTLEASWGPLNAASGSWTAPAAPEPGRRAARTHHVAVTIREKVPLISTEIRLHVDGREEPAVELELGTLSTPLAAMIHDTMDIDELRFYDRVLSDDEIRSLHGMGRFVRRGTYTSPRLVLDAPGRLGRSQWSGFWPEDLRDATGAPLRPIRAWLYAYADRDGTAPLPESPVEIPGEGFGEDLAGLGPVRSLQYQVELDCRDAPGPLTDSPVFESLWLTLRRPSRAPAWEGWSR